MPELPEVETIRRQLLPLYRGEIFREIRLSALAALQNCRAEDFQRLAGKRIDDFHRRGKFLIFECQGIYPVFHLGMSGIFLKSKAESLYPQHIHAEMRFKSGKELFFQDMRRFGNIRLYSEFPQFPGLGIDPLGAEFTAGRLNALLAAKKMNLKQFLMDQRYIAGIGNIYASEILFRARLSPHRKTHELKSRERAALFQAIPAILASAVENFGTTYSAYRTVTGESGENQHFLQVYQREGEPCHRCGRAIIKTVMGSRSTFYCEKCQR